MSRPRWRRWVVLGVVVAVIATTGYLAWRPATLAAAGTPRLVIDRTVIDFGDVSYGRFVTAQFKLTNAGDGPLVLADVPIVKALKGC